MFSIFYGKKDISAIASNFRKLHEIGEDINSDQGKVGMDPQMWTVVSIMNPPPQRTLQLRSSSHCSNVQTTSNQHLSGFRHFRLVLLLSFTISFQRLLQSLLALLIKIKFKSNSHHFWYPPIWPSNHLWPSRPKLCFILVPFSITFWRWIHRRSALSPHCSKHLEHTVICLYLFKSIWSGKTFTHRFYLDVVFSFWHER